MGGRWRGEVARPGEAARLLCDGREGEKGEVEVEKSDGNWVA